MQAKSAVAAGPATWPTAATKILPPHPPAAGLVRERLLARLTASSAGRLTLVHGPAGSGKTYLLAAWAASGHAPGPVAWVSLDVDDDSPDVFWGWVTASLVRAAGLDLDGSDPARAPARIAEAAAAAPHPVTLVLDDFHELNQADLLAQIRMLVRHAPPQLRFMLGSRSVPRLGLHRLRMEGTAHELGPADLAFSVEEARALLTENGSGVSEHAADRLWQRTEGWVAGLRLAAISLEREPEPERFVDDFTGSDRNVSEYLHYEVFGLLDPATQEFLLRTALPDVMTGELAMELTGRIDAAAALEELERTIAFVSHRGSPPVYRYHALFRGFLEAELARRHPADLLRLHAVTAEWLNGQGKPMAAIRHAYAAQAWPLAADLIGQHSALFGTTPALLHELASKVTASALAEEPEIALATAGSHLFRGEPEAAGVIIARAAAALERLSPERRSRVAGGIALAELYRCQLVGDLDGVVTGANRLLDPAATADAGTAQRARLRAIALVNLGSVDITRGELDAAEDKLTRGLELARAGGTILTAFNAHTHLALAAAARGRLRLAATRATETLELARTCGLGRMPQAFSARLALAVVYFLWDDLDAAELHCDRARELAERFAYRPGRVLAGLLGVRLLVARNATRADGALRLLAGLADDLATVAIPPGLAWLGVGLESRLMAIRGDDAEDSLAAAERELGPEAGVAAARLLLSLGRPEDALERLAADAATPAVRIERRVVQAIAHARCNAPDEAHAALESALELAAPDEYRRVLVEGGPPLEALLRDHIRRGTGQRAFAGDVLSAFGRRGPTVALTRLELLEPLTDRERAVLGYLPTMMSNQEIARELFVSKNTVKTHLRHLYRKLGATGRRDAVERGRRLGLL